MMLDTIEVIILTIADQIALMNAEIADMIALVTDKSKPNQLERKLLYFEPLL